MPPLTKAHAVHVNVVGLGSLHALAVVPVLGEVLDERAWRVYVLEH